MGGDWDHLWSPSISSWRGETGWPPSWVQERRDYLGRSPGFPSWTKHDGDQEQLDVAPHHQKCPGPADLARCSSCSRPVSRRTHSRCPTCTAPVMISRPLFSKNRALGECVYVPPVTWLSPHIRSIPMLGVEPGTPVRANPGSWKKISDPQNLVIFNQARKKSSRSLMSQEGRLKSNPSFTSLLQNNLFRETVFSLLQEYKKQENRDYRMEFPFQHYSEEGKED
jgi:hypothetical protein